MREIKVAYYCLLDLIKVINFPFAILVGVIIFRLQIADLFKRLKGVSFPGVTGLFDQTKNIDTNIEPTSLVSTQDILNELAKKNLSGEEFLLLVTIYGHATYTSVPIPLWQIIGNLNENATNKVHMQLIDLGNRGFIIYDRNKQYWTVAVKSETIEFLKPMLRIAFKPIFS
ncbi:MAG: hypothetical protein FD145_311 [Candidatus Saganbacteria bacterium]|uniref:Uncharacterized protein n=1 Tax=Candidatus Saganbacteria bacterium TaxID=2575572 RepID=A0A833P0C7_UNCSA|nr:MAG: hypothetical protein FD145_311 [Candidatus Saganbacteria bacterium]